ncbi:gonadotropin-releasing hormone receptor-like [Anopheles albimanus]|uniref:G-protein coupled receptors family 1 profile domain-containing protein n=1 Tax=Anopheles albimanus TaxID=7167 RepID=A0A8W7K8L2_ANOAL|nr:gonadotropin-releasing hormone receptor-like [Anopheles albimanus]XP_035783038.1 gonadotropin-releasing hormone receptor-like [Anopheles albimanus]
MLELILGNVSTATTTTAATTTPTTTAATAMADTFAGNMPSIDGSRIAEVASYTLLRNASLLLGTSHSDIQQQQQQQQHPIYLSNTTTANDSLATALLHDSAVQLATLASDLITGGTTILSMEECQRLNISFSQNGSATTMADISCYDHAPTLSKSGIIRVIVLSAMAIVSLLGNVATMWNIQKNRKSRRVTRHNWSAIYSLIFHLSIADVLVTWFCIIGEAAWNYTVHWVAGNIFCKLFKVGQMFSLYLSTYVLVLVGVDRWVAVKYPMKSLNTARRCHRFLFVAYLLSFLLSTPQWMIFRVAKGPFLEDFYQCVTHGFYTSRWQEQLYTTFTLVFMFIIPLLILIGTYLSTFMTISSSEKIFRIDTSAVDRTTYYRRSDTNRQRLIHKAKMKSLRISVVIVVAFIVCWTPYYIMMLIFMFLNPTGHFAEDLQSGIFFFGMSNSLINPLIYGAFHLVPIRQRRNQYNQHVREGSVYFQRSSTFNHHNGHQRNLNPHIKFSNSHSNLPEEISLMSLEKDLRSLDENVNQIHQKGGGAGNGTIQRRSFTNKFLSFSRLFNRNHPTKL